MKSAFFFAELASKTKESLSAKSQAKVYQQIRELDKLERLLRKL